MSQPGEEDRERAVTEKTWRSRLKELNDAKAPFSVGLALFFLIMFAGHLLGDPAQPVFGRVLAALAEIVATLSVFLFYREEDLDQDQVSS